MNGKNRNNVVNSINLNPGDVVADIGSGSGYFTRYFVKAVSPGGTALGLEIDTILVHRMMNEADKLESNIYEPRLIKPDNPELEPRSVDVIFLSNTNHHIENRVDYFKRLSKSLCYDRSGMITFFIQLRAINCGNLNENSANVGDFLMH